nr:PEP-CTERM sorting domain-containing protein [uncultured Albidiferax sp.]
MKNKIYRSLLGQVATTVGLVLGCSSAMADFVLPAAPCTGSNCLQYTDFSVYSLALINLQGGGSGAPTTGQPGFVSAATGQIQNYVVVGVNAQGVEVNTNIAGIDNAYNTPSGGASTFTNLTTDVSNGPSAGDGNSWQASIATLSSQFLNSKFVAFFSFTEPGTSSPPKPLLGADLLIWAKISAIDLQDPFATKSFYLQPNGSVLNNDPLASALPPDTTLGDSGPWVYVHSKMCVAGTTFVSFPDVTGSCPVGSSIKDTNTGQNNASFALYNAELDAIIHDGLTPFDVLQVDWEMAYINGGGEAAWFQPFDVAGSSVPEPSTMMLMAVALLGLWGTQRNRNRR